MTTTPMHPSSEGDEKMEELDRPLAEDSPRGERFRELGDFVRVRMFGLEPLCPECEKGEEESGESRW